MSDPQLPGGGWALRRHLSLETACGLEQMKTVRVCCGLCCKYFRRRFPRAPFLDPVFALSSSCVCKVAPGWSPNYPQPRAVL